MVIGVSYVVRYKLYIGISKHCPLNNAKAARPLEMGN
jgi:hypothetical protein